MKTILSLLLCFLSLTVLGQWKNQTLYGFKGKSIYVSEGGNLTDAKNSSQAGDTIFVGPGTYIITNTIAKNGVDWELHGPMEIRLTNSYVAFETNLVQRGGAGIFDDRFNGAVTSVVHGIGSVKLIWHSGEPVVWDANPYYVTNCMGAIVITNNLSRITGRNLDIEIAAFTQSTASANGIQAKNGTNFFVNCSITTLYRTNILVHDALILDNTAYFGNAGALFWEHGDIYFNGPFIDADMGYAIWCDDSANAQPNKAHNLWVDVPFIKGKFYTSGFTNRNWRSWITCKEIAAGTNGANGAIETVDGGRIYVTAQKIGATPSGNPSQANIAAITQSGLNDLWVTTQKITATNGPFVKLDRSAGNGFGGGVHVNCMQYEDLGSIPIGFLVQSSTLNVHGGTAYVTNGIAAKLDIGGTLNVNNARLVVTATTSNAVVRVETNSLTIANSVLVAPATGRGIWAKTTNDVVVMNSMCNVASSNTLVLAGPYGTNTAVR